MNVFKFRKEGLNILQDVIERTFDVVKNELDALNGIMLIHLPPLIKEKERQKRGWAHYVT